MNTKFHLLTAALIAALTSCSQAEEQKTEEQPKEYTELQKAAWFLGNWENNFPEGRATESWEQINDSTYTGASLVVIGKDTVNSETIRLEERSGKLLYIPTVSDQNKGKEVVFTLTSSSDKKLVFENPRHDFPQKITYTKINNDSIVAEISGMMEGKMHSEPFPMSRVK